jgi:hypothetical protein
MGLMGKCAPLPTIASEIHIVLFLTLWQISQNKCTVGNSSSTNEPLVNLCDFNKEIDTFLSANHHMYIFYKKYLCLVSQFRRHDL